MTLTQAGIKSMDDLYKYFMLTDEPMTLCFDFYKDSTKYRFVKLAAETSDDFVNNYNRIRSDLARHYTVEPSADFHVKVHHVNTDRPVDLTSCVIRLNDTKAIDASACNIINATGRPIHIVKDNQVVRTYPTSKINVQRFVSVEHHAAELPDGTSITRNENYPSIKLDSKPNTYYIVVEHVKYTCFHDRDDVLFVNSNDACSAIFTECLYQ